MTDTICSQDGCCFPLMRSKDGSLSFCTHHDPLPSQGAHHNYKTTPKEQKAVPKDEPVESKTLKSLPTEPKTMSNSLLAEPAIIDNGEEELRIRRERRDQSSKASQLIGQKMLQRWALLNEHCPNSSCYAVIQLCLYCLFEILIFPCRFHWFVIQTHTKCIVLFVRILF